MAIDAMDRWLSQIKQNRQNRQNRQKTVAENKPSDIQDACFNRNEKLLAKGPKVLDGKWNNKETGQCLRLYPNFMSSRHVAGSPTNGSVFKCHVQSIEQAIERGIYDDIDIKPHLKRLKKIFPEGVCDYSKGDLGRPADI